MARDLARALKEYHTPSEIEPVDYTPDWSPATGPKPPATGPVALDLETVRGTSRVVQVNLAWGHGQAVAGTWNEEVRGAVRELLAAGGLRIFHNAQFDLPVLWENGIETAGPIYDTMIAAAILEPDLPNNLEHVAKDYTDVGPWKHLSTQDLMQYGCIDADVTYRIYEGTKAELEAEGVWKCFCISMEVLPVLIQMQRQGLRVSKDEMLRRAAVCTEKEIEARDDLDEMAAALKPRQERIASIQRKMDEAKMGLVPQAGLSKGAKLQLRREIRRAEKALDSETRVNWASPAQLVRVMDDMGLPQKTNPKTGRVTTDATVIQELARQTGNRVLKRLLDLRGAQKLRTTYYEQELSDDEKIHPQYLIHRDYDVEGGVQGACSGRLASKGPNIQNWPPEARSIILPDWEDWEFMEPDYVQIEFRIIAWATDGSGRINWRGGVWDDVQTPGFDIHRRVAAAVYGINVDMVTPEQRAEGKRCVYAGAYGVGPLTLSRRLAAKGIFMSVAECKKFIGAFKRLYPSVIERQKKWLDEALATNRIRNPFGRYRRFYNPSNEVTEIYNYYPQSTAGDIILRAMSALNTHLPRPARLAIQVHDSLVIAYPKAMREKVKRCVIDHMTVEHPEMPGFTVPVEIKTGSSWGSMTSKLGTF